MAATADAQEAKTSDAPAAEADAAADRPKRRRAARPRTKPEAAEPGTEVEVMLLGERRPGRVLGEAAYDPDNLRPRADAP